MATKHDKPAVETDTRPSSADQAPGGSPHAPAPLEGWTGEPEHGPDHTHPTEEAAEAHKHARKGQVEMHKDGVKIHVHPETVEAHHSAGWQKAE